MIWLDKCFDFDVEKHEVPRSHGRPYYQMPVSTGIAVLHTTESNHVDGSLRMFETHFDPPHFCVGEGRIVQCRAIGTQAGALHDPANQRAYCQIEIVGFSSQTPWLPADPSLQPLVALMAYAQENWDIPLRAPCDWPDDCSDLKGQVWASRNSRRKLAENGKWNTEEGFWMHLECPFQGPSYHWDCGAIERTKLFTMAEALNNP